MGNKIYVSFKCDEQIWKDVGLILNDRSAFLENHLKNLLISVDLEKVKAGYYNQTKDERIKNVIETLERIYAKNGSIGRDMMEQLCLFRDVSMPELEDNLNPELKEHIVEYTLRTKETKSSVYSNGRFGGLF